MGLPTIAMGLLALSRPPAEAAALLIVPSLVTNFAQIGGARGLRPLFGLLWPFLLGVVVATPLGFLLWGGVGGRGAEAALGVALVLYAALGLSGWRPRLPRSWGWAAGAGTGLAASATGLFLLPAVPWLQSQGLPREGFVRAFGLVLTVSQLVLAAGIAGTGEVDWPASALALLPALAGMRLGAMLRARLSEEVFRPVLLAVIGLLGAHALWRGLH